MHLIPAIDLISGEAVRLTKGDYDSKIVYSKEPAELAVQFQEAGAKYLHIVDLDAAKSGKPENLSVLIQIAKRTNLILEWGGGLRNMDSLKKVRDAGVSRLILGTIAISNPKVVEEALLAFGTESIVVGIDAKLGIVKTSGWEENSGKEASALFAEMIEIGIKHFIYTDIDKDGTLSGPSLASYNAILHSFPEIELVASGGVSSLDDLRALYAIGRGVSGVAKASEPKACLFGAILGKSIYEGKIDPRIAFPLFQTSSTVTI